jgi:hypothetical protein
MSRKVGSLVLGSMKLVAVAVLAVVLALSSTQNAFAASTLAYDDGTNEDDFAMALGSAAVDFAFPLGDRDG